MLCYAIQIIVKCHLTPTSFIVDVFSNVLRLNTIVFTVFEIL